MVPPAGSPSHKSWTELLSAAPFSDGADFRHKHHASVHGRLCGAYAKQCGSLWRADAVMRWLHASASRLVQMHESAIFANKLAASREAWCSAPLSIVESLTKDYSELLPDDVGEAPRLPTVLDKAAQARLHPPMPQTG